jgi:hypothetical protein
MKTQLKLLGDHQPCPTCARLCAVETESRSIQARGGTIQYNEPVCHCPACLRDFFPLRPTLRLNSHGFSPAILGQIARFAASCGSFEDASESLEDGAEITISDRQVDRIAQEIGEQLRQDRDRLVEQFQDRQAVPEVPVVPRLAAVFVDGGRLQVRSEDPNRGPGVHDLAWRENKVANLLTMSTQSRTEDPHPELPDCFTKKRQVVELVQGISGQGALADVVQAHPEESPSLTLVEPTEADTKPRPCWPPEPLVRTCPATMEPSEAFGPMVAAEANRRRFFEAQARVFVGDGGLWIWTLHRLHSSTFEPVVDFVRMFAYIYLAARAIGGPATYASTG